MQKATETLQRSGRLKKLFFLFAAIASIAGYGEGKPMVRTGRETETH